MKRDDAGKSRGYGFIRYASYESQEMVIGKSHFIEGRSCEVKIPHSKVHIFGVIAFFDTIALMLLLLK